MLGRQSRCLVAVAAAAMAALACTGSNLHPKRATDSTISQASARCVVTTGELPSWARAGFSVPTTFVPYVLGAKRDIVGVLFGNPLRSPPRAHRNNKILWVSRFATHGDALDIQARLNGSDRVVSRAVKGGPGPSIIDMPAAGCWIFTLSWSGHTDRAAVRYNAN